MASPVPHGPRGHSRVKASLSRAKSIHAWIVARSKRLPYRQSQACFTSLTTTGMLVLRDVDDDLNPRQMRWQGAPVTSASFGPCRTLGGRHLVCRRLLACHSLLDVFETQQHLVFGQCLRPAAKPMSLHFLDDLTQPLVLHSLGEQHRFQRLGI